MTCSCCGSSQGLKLNQFKEIETVAGDELFVLADNTLMSYETLVVAARTFLPDPDIVEADISFGYELSKETDILICRGSGIIYMPSVAAQRSQVTIISTDGDAEIEPLGTDATDRSVVTAGNSFVATPYQFSSKWIEA